MASNRCATKYPILLVHGVGFRDTNLFNYWGRIPEILRENGASVFHGYQDGWGSIEHNAEILKNTIEGILKKTGAGKVNIIAHSKGGLDSRYLISSLGKGENVASLTTVGTPHHGSKAMDKIYDKPKILFKLVSGPINKCYELFGDKKPDFFHVCGQFTTTYAEDFNKSQPDDKRVFYQSYAAKMNNSLSDVVLSIPHFVINAIEGGNDGLVSIRSAQWTNFKGIIKGTTNRGVSHLDEVDLRRFRLSRKARANRINDIADFYLSLVEELKTLGY